MIPQNYPLYVVTDGATVIGLVIGWGDYADGSQPRPFVQALSGKTNASAYLVGAGADVHYFVSRAEAEVYVKAAMT